MAAINGEQYINRIDRLKANVWIDGEQVESKISEHPAFKGVIGSQAKLYDIQHEKTKQAYMMFDSPSTGDRVGASYLVPKTKEDLEQRRLATQEWAKSHAGMMGRSPDYMNSIVMAFYSAADLFAEQEPKCATNMRNFFEYARENDLSLTHTFIQPQVDRSGFFVENPKDIIAASMVDKTKDGIVIKGARLLATQGGITDEIVVFPSGAKKSSDERYAYAFSIPSNTPGLKFICRESFDYGKSKFDHPLGSQFEEIDTIVVFDNVLVPWNRVFLHGNVEAANNLYKESSFLPHVAHQAVSKNIIKTEFILGVIQLVVDTINIGEYQHVQEKISEVIIALETLKSFVTASEANAKLDQWGTMTPDSQPLFAAMNYFPRIYPRFTEIIQLLGASGLVSIPSEKDFGSLIRDDLDQYLISYGADAYDRVKLFRLAWDISLSAFGGRQTLYERFYFGDPVRLAGGLYRTYNRSKYVNRVQDFLADES
jgi:4-hydroxyphenylacetate 3-monooxygenase